MMKLRYFLPFLALSATLRTTAAEPPRLVVQIVVSSMRAEDLNRYAGNFSDEGFLRLVRGGTFYPESHYDYLHTSTPFRSPRSPREPTLRYTASSPSGGSIT